VDILPTPGGCVIAVRVRPRSRAGASVVDGILTLSVAAPAVDGRATEAARRLLAEALGVAPSRVRVRSGARSRRKAYEVVDMAPDQAERLLEGSAR
jgi:uncharacterized protein YggU (UPF0235/DUF167 family)